MKEIQTTHNKEGIIASDEYYTPIEFVNALGNFDLDPCVPMDMRNRTATVMYNKEQDGLKQDWKGRVCQNRLIAMVYMRRDDWNYTELTMVFVGDALKACEDFEKKLGFFKKKVLTL